MSHAHHLPYHQPFDWPRMLRFLGARSVMGVECVLDGAYLRTVLWGAHSGWLRVRNEPEKRALAVELSPGLEPVQPPLLAQLRHLFDLDAHPATIRAHFAHDPLLGSAVAHRPGLRVPGAFNGFELAARAILGQQITVKAATTLAGRFASAFGSATHTPNDALTHLSPTAERVADARAEKIAALGVLPTRAQSLIALAKEFASGRLALEAGAAPAPVIAQLVALPGIGAWTAQYIAMRALRWADAFPREDIALRNALGRVTPARAEKLSEPWRPWRSYATVHLWFAAAEKVEQQVA